MIPQLQALCGTRSSLLLHLQFPLAPSSSHTCSPEPSPESMAVELTIPDNSPRSATMAAPSILSRQRLGVTLPLVLVPLPPGLAYGALAFGDRPLLLKLAPDAGGIEVQPLAATHVARAAPWWHGGWASGDQPDDSQAGRCGYGLSLTGSDMGFMLRSFRPLTRLKWQSCGAVWQDGQAGDALQWTAAHCQGYAACYNSKPCSSAPCSCLLCVRQLCAAVSVCWT